MKLMDFIKQPINIPSFCLLALTVRSVIYGASIGDSIAILGATALYGAIVYLNDKSKDQSEQVTDDLRILKDALSSIKMTNSIRKTHEKPKKDDRTWF